MNLLDRHIFKSVLFTCLAAVGLFAFVLTLANFVKELLGPVLAGQISIPMLVKLILLLLPFAFSYALPMGILTGVLLTLGRLSADSEVTAMRAAGIGLVRVARPVFLLGALSAVAALHVNFESMPRARVQYHREFAEAVRKDPLAFIVPKTFIRDFRGVVVYVGESDGQSGLGERDGGRSLLRDIWIWELDNQGRVQRLVRAESGRVRFDPEIESMILNLQRVKIEERDLKNPEDFSVAPRAPSIEVAEEMRLPMAGSLGHGIAKVKPEWLTYRAFLVERDRVGKLPVEPGKEKESARARMKLAMIVHEKANLSLAVFAFAFIAVPLGIKVSRRETSANLGVSVLLVLGYYILLTMVKGLDRHPEYRPDLLLWVPNLLFFGFGFWLLRRVER